MHWTNHASNIKHLHLCFLSDKKNIVNDYQIVAVKDDKFAMIRLLQTLGYPHEFAILYSKNMIVNLPLHLNTALQNLSF